MSWVLQVVLAALIGVGAVLWTDRLDYKGKSDWSRLIFGLGGVLSLLATFVHYPDFTGDRAFLGFGVYLVTILLTQTGLVIQEVIGRRKAAKASQQAEKK